MIVRSFRGLVVRGREAVFYEIVRRRMTEFRASYTLIDCHVARRMTDAGDTFLITTHWPDWAELLDWAGGEPDKPWGFDEIIPYLKHWDIEHFEEIDVAESGSRSQISDQERLSV